MLRDSRLLFFGLCLVGCTTCTVASPASAARQYAATLLAPGSEASEGSAINDVGQVTGTVRIAPSIDRAFIYSAGALTLLDTLGGDSNIGVGITFLYSDGKMHDLNSLVVSGLGADTLTNAVGINDSGQIVANACPSTRPCVGYRLDPIEPDGGGGCASIVSSQGGPIDPTLPVLLMLSLIGMFAGSAPLEAASTRKVAPGEPDLDVDEPYLAL